MKNGEMKTLREWIDVLKITPVTYKGHEMYKSSVKQERNGYIDIFLVNGYGVLHSDIDKYLDALFFAQNVDIHDVKLCQKYW